MRTLVICAALFILVMSAVLFVLMGADKRFARHRHKTKHWYFVLGFWALAAAQLGALAWAAYRYV